MNYSHEYSSVKQHKNLLKLSNKNSLFISKINCQYQRNILTNVTKNVCLSEIPVNSMSEYALNVRKK